MPKPLTEQRRSSLRWELSSSSEEEGPQLGSRQGVSDLLRSAAVPAAVRRASRSPRRGQDALGTAGKMPALPKPGIVYRCDPEGTCFAPELRHSRGRGYTRSGAKTKSRAMKARDRERTSNRRLACLAFQHLNRFVQLFILLWRLFLAFVSGSSGVLVVW